MLYTLGVPAAQEMVLIIHLTLHFRDYGKNNVYRQGWTNTKPIT